MNKIYLWTLILFLIFSVLFYKKDQKEIISYELNGKALKLLVADNNIKWERGLMNIKNLKNADGMIFLFPDKKTRIFWNKNTYLNLDVYWINDDKLVGKDFLPSIKNSKEIIYIKSPVPVNKVIEIEHK